MRLYVCLENMSKSGEWRMPEGKREAGWAQNALAKDHFLGPRGLSGTPS